MAKKPHIKLNSAEQGEGAVRIQFNYGFGRDVEDEIKEEPDYIPMTETFRGSLTRLNAAIETRRAERNEALQIPAQIDYIKILFQDQFNISDFYHSWYNDFGLLGVNFSKFNREVLFAVNDQDKFSSFLQDIENFILRESGEDEQVEYRGKVKFIKDFKLLTTQEILIYKDIGPLMNFRLIEFPAGSPEATTIYTRLAGYLDEVGFKYRLLEETNILEVYGATPEKLEEIAKNIDILLSVTSTFSSVISPSEINTVERGYGFEISNQEEDLPIIGILDTGISNNTPLSPIIINDDTFNLTDTSSFIDNANDGFGHGTSIAALATLGRKPYSVNYAGGIRADAKLLSMKILDKNSGYLSMNDIVSLLQRAKIDYPKVKIFILTTCYSDNKSTNEDFSAYAYSLDKFSHENDCLIFICTANNNNASNQPGYDLNYFNNEETNLCSPAESMNNVIVGAAADNITVGPFMGISGGREFPTLYTRKSHLDLSDLFATTKQNKNFFRPDVIECAGDLEQGDHYIGTGTRASMEVLSADPAFGFYKDVGTSFSTPLVANIAAQILKAYPALKAQTIKALIVNGSSLETIRFDPPFLKLQNKVAGYGLVNPAKSITSTENAITFVIEDEIEIEEMKIIPLNFPAYLTEDDLGKRMGVLYLTATLCFSFIPVLNNHLSYCPIQMAFSIFRNHSGDQILQKEKEIKSKLKSSWSQNNRWRTNPVPASNTQKITFPINVKDLEDENSTFKLAVHCLINTQLLSDSIYKTSHSFSMAITIEERLTEAYQTGKLYAEMLAVNEVENIIHLEGEADIDIELLG